MDESVPPLPSTKCYKKEQEKTDLASWRERIYIYTNDDVQERMS